MFSTFILFILSISFLIYPTLTIGFKKFTDKKWSDTITIKLFEFTNCSSRRTTVNWVSCIQCNALISPNWIGLWIIDANDGTRINCPFIPHWHESLWESKHMWVSLLILYLHDTFDIRIPIPNWARSNQYFPFLYHSWIFCIFNTLRYKRESKIWYVIDINI